MLEYKYHYETHIHIWFSNYLQSLNYEEMELVSRNFDNLANLDLPRRATLIELYISKQILSTEWSDLTKYKYLLNKELDVSHVKLIKAICLEKDISKELFIINNLDIISDVRKCILDFVLFLECPLIKLIK